MIASHYYLLAEAFSSFFNQNFESVSIPDDPLKKASLNHKNDTFKPNSAFSINQKAGIVFFDYQFLRSHFPNINNKEGLNSIQTLDTLTNSNQAFDIVKCFRDVVNSLEYFENLKKDNKGFEFRLTNYGRMKRITEINTNLMDCLITIRGTVIYRWDEVRNMANARIWRCKECGKETKEKIERGEKIKQYKGRCINKIGEGNQAFICNNRTYNFVKDDELEDIFRVRIEALNEDCEDKAQLTTFYIEFTNNICKEEFINKVLNGEVYEFTGIVKFDQTENKQKRLVNTPYLKLMSFKKIEKRQKIIKYDEVEKKKIIDFLKRKDSIDKLTEMFGNRIIGYDREKKFFLILKALQMAFNRDVKNKNPKDYLCHMCIVGDYSTGKSEFAEVCMELCDNGNYIIGSATTGVGLTGRTERDEFTGRYVIQAGVLARTSGDVLIIEEFDKQDNKSEFGVINEAMSKYQYTITKAGESRTFICNTCVIVIANPTEKAFDRNESLYDQIDIQGDLLSRFTAVSCILDQNDIDKDNKITDVIIQRNKGTLVEKDRKNVEFIKKCLMVASETEVDIDTKEFKDFIKAWNNQIHVYREQVYDLDKKFLSKLGTARSRADLIKIIKGVAMLHLHETPTKEDMEEGRILYTKFQEEIIKNPEFMNVDHLQIGKSLADIRKEYAIKNEEIEFNEKIEKKKESKKGRYELLIELIKKNSDTNTGCPLDFLKEEAKQKLEINEFQFEEMIKLLTHNGNIYEPRQGYIFVI